ncbi:gamma-glutamyltransferase [Halochromatium salexigens]|uniref:Glutathione hydrolase proenzyme n=1 Tax=Halochromatium salexigens TaxID=49447 RepID=A0AAJ0UGU5_HALSE|nr:gamma-glutamyltransferase [Halochromatium salexigens]
MFLLVALLLPVWAFAESVVLAESAESPRPPAMAVATAHPRATEAGLALMAAGGNAFDAAVAISAVLAVVEPYSSGLGGGGFWLLHRAADGRDLMVDGRERAPLAATRDLYLDDSGALIKDASLNGPLAAGVPGAPAALVHIAERYGTLPLSESLAPAIRLAREGFEVDELYRRMASWRLEVLRASPSAAAQFLEAGEVPELGTLIRQPDLAAVLEALAAHGRAGFYEGEIARALVAGTRAAGGIWTLEDLGSYRVVEREPVVGHYQGWEIVSAAPPSSGGVALVQMLGMLEALEARLGVPSDEADRVHRLVEVMRRAYRDRALYLGDPDQVEVPIERLTHPYYTAGLARGVDPMRATPSVSRASASEGADTTHFSILDAEGNRVAATLSINYPFGSGFVPPGTGVLLNDEMDDFSSQPGVPNAYGLIGGEANAIAPGKRMLSSMSPTFATSEDQVVILGTPGGSRIITMVLHGILTAIAGGDPQDWVALPRFHHQDLPDEILFEPEALGPELRQALRARGHRLSPAAQDYGNMQLIAWDRAAKRVRAASDPRGIGKAEVRELP